MPAATVNRQRVIDIPSAGQLFEEINEITLPASSPGTFTTSLAAVDGVIVGVQHTAEVATGWAVSGSTVSIAFPAAGNNRPATVRILGRSTL